MRTVLDIFLKDVRQMRWMLLVWAALLAAQLASCLSAKQTTIADWDILTSSGPKFPLWTLLHWLGLVVITFEVLLADRAFGTEPWWKTRPVARWQMAVAKLGFIGAFLVVLPVGLEVVSFVGQDVPVRQAFEGGLVPLLSQSFVVGWMVLLAILCRRKTVEVVVLASLALAAPFGLYALFSAGYNILTKWEFLQAVWTIGWENPPDYLAYPEGYHLRIWVFLASLPVLAHYGLTLHAYLAQSRCRIAAWLVALLAIWFVTPLVLMVQGIRSARPVPTAPIQRISAEASGLTLTWKQYERSWRHLSVLEATRFLPELPSASGSLSVVQPGSGWGSLQLTKQSATEPTGFKPHFALPEQNPTRFSDSVGVKEPDKFLNRSLARKDGPLETWLGRHTVLNLQAPDAEPLLRMVWEADRPLTNFTHATIGLRLPTQDSECHLVERTTFADFRARHPTTNAEPADANFFDPRYSVTTVTRHVASLPVAGWVGDVSPVRKAVLWHPKRREVLLPDSSFSDKAGNLGVVALPGLLPVAIHTHTSHFPHTPKGKEPQPGAPGPEWFAEAELLLLAFKPVTNRHHVILVPDVKLPPVPPVSPSPSKP